MKTVKTSNPIENDENEMTCDKCNVYFPELYLVTVTEDGAWLYSVMVCDRCLETDDYLSWLEKAA